MRAFKGTPASVTSRRAYAASHSVLRERPARSISATVKLRNNGLSCAKKDSPGGIPPLSTDRPSTRISPVVGLRSPVVSDSSVLLPAPLGPTSAHTLPRGSENVQSRNPHPLRYRLPNPTASNAAIPSSSTTSLPHSGIGARESLIQHGTDQRLDVLALQPGLTGLRHPRVKLPAEGLLFGRVAARE